MALKLLDILSIALATLVFGVFWGPWLALSRSIAGFPADVFLAVVHRMDRNLAPTMTFLMPASMLSIALVALFSFPHHRTPFVLSVGALLLFGVAAAVTAIVEVPIVARIRHWSTSSMPDDWTSQRDRWVAFHLVRVAAGSTGLLLLLAAAIL
jgi:hypothetical protein